MFKLLSLGILAWGFFNPTIASIVFILMFITVECYVAFAGLSGRGMHGDKLTARENALLREYFLFFRYPMTSRGLSSTIAGFQASAFIWVPLLIYKQYYVQALIIGINYFVAAPLAVKLNPQHYLRREALKGSPEREAQLIEIESLLNKLYPAPKMKK